MRQFTNQGIVKTFFWPLWFPFPSSWLKSVGLCVLLGAVFSLIGLIANIHSPGLKNLAENPDFFIVLMIGSLLFPIPVIAFGHEIYQFCLTGFFKKNSPAQTEGVLPSMISWWEGLYSWFVFIISSLIVTALIEIILPLFNLSFVWLWEPEWLAIKVGLILGLWLAMAAGFYQLEFLVKQGLIEFGAAEFKRLSLSSPQSQERKIDFVDRITEPEIKETLPKIEKKVKERPVFKLGQFIWLFFKKALIPLIIILGVLRSYSLSQLTQAYQGVEPAEMAVISPFPVTVPWFLSQNLFCQKTQEILTGKPRHSNLTKNPITSEAPLPVPYAPPLPQKPSKFKIEAPQVSLQIDPFQQAIYRATTAANLAKLAKTEVEWKGVSRQWQDAIKLMQAVPVDSPQYKLAQKKVKEYEQNLIYAQKAAGGKNQNIGG